MFLPRKFNDCQEHLTGFNFISQSRSTSSNELCHENRQYFTYKSSSLVASDGKSLTKLYYPRTQAGSETAYKNMAISSYTADVFSWHRNK